MPKTLTQHQLSEEIKTIRWQLTRNNSCELRRRQTALLHIKEEFDILEDYQMGLISTTEFYIKLATLVENRYEG